MKTSTQYELFGVIGMIGFMFFAGACFNDLQVAYFVGAQANLALAFASWAQAERFRGEGK